jgi:sec-independent protein translocase protein TatA
MLRNIGTIEIIIIAVVLMILFGTKKIPEFARGLGQASQEFKKGYRGDNKTKNSKKETEETE